RSRAPSWWRRRSSAARAASQTTPGPRRSRRNRHARCLPGAERDAAADPRHGAEDRRARARAARREARARRGAALCLHQEPGAWPRHGRRRRVHRGDARGVARGPPRVLRAGRGGDRDLAGVRRRARLLRRELRAGGGDDPPPRHPGAAGAVGAGLMSGEVVGAWGLTEPGAGSDAFGSMGTTARPDGDAYVLNGQKTFITNAPYADVFVIYAKLEENGARSIQPFLIERERPGLDVSKPFRKMGTHASPTG